jgi:hypothetical protein
VRPLLFLGLMGTTERPKAQPSPQHKKGQSKFLYFGLIAVFRFEDGDGRIRKLFAVLSLWAFCYP